MKPPASEENSKLDCAGFRALVSSPEPEHATLEILEPYLTTKSESGSPVFTLMFV